MFARLMLGSVRIRDFFRELLREVRWVSRRSKKLFQVGGYSSSRGGIRRTVNITDYSWTVVIHDFDTDVLKCTR